MEVEIPKYDVENGFQHHWEDGFEVKVTSSEKEVLLSANKAGLISLAVQLLTLAQDDVPSNYHYHLDEYNSLGVGSKQLIIRKI